MPNNYVVYHLHTENSLLDSCTNYKLYVDKAVELGQKAICFTEHGNIYNWIEKKMYCEEKGIKFLKPFIILCYKDCMVIISNLFIKRFCKITFYTVKILNTLFLTVHFLFYPVIDIALTMLSKTDCLLI